MYWTEYAAKKRSRIMKADLDGQNPIAIVRLIYKPFGITFDLNSSSVVWTDHGEHEVLTWHPSPKGRRNNVRTVAYWMNGNRPTGIAVASNGKVFWGTYGGGRNLQSTQWQFSWYHHIPTGCAH